MIRALLVTGDQEAASDVTQILRDFCPNVTLSATADSIRAGVSAINMNQPDILILDTKLSDGNGFEIVKHFDTHVVKRLIMFLFAAGMGLIIV